MIRLAQVDDIKSLSDIERAADAVFRSEGMATVADGDTMPIPELLRYQRAGRVWVDTDEVDRPIAYLLLDVIDGSAHIEQVSVHPSHAGRGKGRQLIEAAAEWAKQQGHAMLTLTTFANVPWNAPYYARLGFEIIPPDKITPGLREIRQHEASAGLDAWPRVVMRRTLRNQLN
ncbi:GNAT family N-acetyltransferase [Arthrobacter burdickii]|uniref:GNAT family N-acetyltransferase n=1 Tax=Arthrobacter burdickii TaxID=3035920 RepID=A0ABT8JWN8_9MICC|nr:GNAT family N-acetyltransferase [Arthrobacter burdickii]MDN4609590.1 GNAT family N-acetyltransferase [Arthrobacter burdickii]